MCLFPLTFRTWHARIFPCTRPPATALPFSSLTPWWDGLISFSCARHSHQPARARRYSKRAPPSSKPFQPPQMGWRRVSSTTRVDGVSQILSYHPTFGLAARAIPTAAVERALFHRARSGSKGMPWLRDRPFTATPTRHIPSQSNTAPLHRHRVDQVQAVCRRHQPNQ